MNNRRLTTVLVCLFCACLGLGIGFVIGLQVAPEPTTEALPPSPPVGPTDTSASLNITVINPSTTGKDVTLLIFDDHGKQLFTCKTVAPAGGTSVPINASWTNVTSYDNTTFLITVNSRSRAQTPVIETREIEWVCLLGLHDFTLITLPD